MKEKEFDNIVKQKLESINEAPPAYMWDKISSGIPATAPNSTSWFKANLKSILVAASILIIGGLSYLVSNEGTNTLRETSYKESSSNAHYTILETQKLNKETIQNNQRDSENKSLIFTSETEKSPSKTENLAIQNKENTPSLPESSNPITNRIETPFESQIRNTSLNQPSEKKDNSKAIIQEASLVVSVSETPVAENPKSNQELSAVKSSEEPIEEEVVSENIEPEEKESKTSEQDVQSTEQNETNTESTPSETEIKTRNHDLRARQLNKYGLGIHYGPEFINAGEFKLTDQAFDLSFNYQNMNFILQTGLGLRFSKDQTAYNMSYERWEYLETQIRFDSVIFVIDKNGNYVAQPVNPYYEEVYDSINHSYYATATVNNTMIQIPILLGYQKDYKNFAVFVKGGIRYSLIVYQQTKGLIELDGQSKLISFNYPEKTRAKSNIDYELSVGGAYKLNKNLQIQAEIFGRYYHYPLYIENPPRETNPWSSSFRVGLVYIF